MIKKLRNALLFGRAHKRRAAKVPQGAAPPPRDMKRVSSVDGSLQDMNIQMCKNALCDAEGIERMDLSDNNAVLGWCTYRHFKRIHFAPDASSKMRVPLAAQERIPLNPPRHRQVSLTRRSLNTCLLRRC